MSKSKGEVAVVDPAEYALMQRDPAMVREVIEANLGDGGISDFELQRVKVPGSGATFWTVERLDGEESTKALTGVIVASRTVRLYWSKSIDESGGGDSPDCISDDGVTGKGNPGGECSDCALAQWGSDPKGGRGQACKQMRLLFLLEPHSLLPLVVAVPPTSLKPMRAYMLKLSSEALPHYQVVTSLTLAKQRNADGIEYAEIVPTMESRLTPEQAAQMRAYAETLAPTVAAVRVDDLREAEDEAPPAAAADEEIPF